MNEIRMTVHGNVVSEPVQRTTRTGGVFTTFRVASTPFRRTPDGKYVDLETTYLGVIAFNALAANAASSLRKGQPVVVEGTFSVRRYTGSDGQPRESSEVEASHIGHDLSWGRAAFERVSKAAALGQDRSSELEVREAVAAMHAADAEREGGAGSGGRDQDPRPSWVDANGEVEDDFPEQGSADLSDPSRPSDLGDPETDPYRVADEPAA